MSTSTPPTYHMSPEEFRRWGYAVIDWIAEYQEHVADYPVLAQVQPGEVRAKLPPQSGAEVAAIKPSSAAAAAPVPEPSN